MTQKLLRKMQQEYKCTFQKRTNLINLKNNISKSRLSLAVKVRGFNYTV